MYLSPAQKLGLPILAVTLPAALVASTIVFGDTVKSVVPTNQIVKVRGVAERVIVADRVNFSIEVEASAPELDKAYAKVDDAVAKLDAYLVAAGIPAAALHKSAHSQSELTQRVILDKLGNDRYERTGYRVTQSVSLKDYEDLDLVEKVADRIASDLSRTGLPINPGRPYFFFHRDVTDLKPELLKQAARSAFERASIVAESSGSKLGGLRAARQGAFEGLGSDGFVGGHEREQRIRAIVTVDYAIGG